MTLLWILGCADPPVDDPAPTELPTASAYTAACEDALGTVPSLSCDGVPPVLQQATLADGTVVPLTARTDALPDGSCDRPSILSGCVPGSRAGVVENDRGTRFYLLCRVTRSDTPEGLYDDVALLGRDEDGTTCMWGTPEDGAWRDGTVLPRPDDVGYWADVPVLAEIGCRSCHDGNAIVVTPWIAANLPPADPDGPQDLLFADVLATVDPTWAGTPLWVHPDAAACTTCHSLPEGPACTFGPASTGRLPDPALSPALSRWPTDRWMDDLDPAGLVARHGDEAGWEATFGAAADRLMACCGAQRDGCWE